MSFVQAPKAVVVTDAGGNALNLGGGSGTFTQGPQAIVITDAIGNQYTVGTGIGAASFPLLAPDGTNTAPSYSFSSEGALGFYRSAAGRIGISHGSAERFAFDTANSAMVIPAGWSMGFCSTSFVDGSLPDTGYSRISPGVLAIGNGTAGNTSGFLQAKLGGFAQVSLSAQTAAKTTTPLLTGGAATGGVYRVTFYHVTSQAATTSGSSQLTLSWNDGYASQTSTDTTLTNVLGNFQQGQVVIRVPNNQNISYAASYASSGATVYKYDLYVTLEQLQ